MREKAIQIKNLTVNYGNYTALEGVCLDVLKGEYLGIIGPNGGGKTTLIKSILGLIEPSFGEIEIFGAKADKNKVAVGYVPQFAKMDKNFPITVEEVVQSGFIKPGIRPFFRYSLKERQMAEECLDKVGISVLADRQISELSGGEFQKMLIARALAVRPEILLLDEPTASVDAVSAKQIYTLLKELNQKITVIMVTHDLLAVSSHVKRLACLNKELVYHGEPELNEKIVEHLYGCPVDLIAHGVPHRVLKEHERGE